jgi:hypothetical protein
VYRQDTIHHSNRVRAEGKAGQKGMRLLRDCLETKYFNTVVLEYHGI